MKYLWLQLFKVRVAFVTLETNEILIGVFKQNIDEINRKLEQITVPQIVASMNEKMQFIKIRSRVLIESTRTIALFFACYQHPMSYEIGNLCIIRANYANCNERKNID